ncbi:MAG: hypothetical protein AB7P03_25950 [Kofleriaceae bacterium]
MRITNIVTFGLAGLSMAGMAACASTAASARGATYREHGGPVQVVFTNASAEAMCGFYMSFKDADKYGDNWLPETGLPSGKSIEFRVKPGVYKARWESCSSTGGIPHFAATLSHDSSFVIDQETQLFAYVADKVAPTKRAPILDRRYKKVTFQGQAIEPVDGTSRTSAAHRVSSASASAPEPAAEPAAASPAAAPRENFDGFVDPSAKKAIAKNKQGKRKAVRPSLRRSHDLASSRVDYRVR